MTSSDRNLDRHYAGYDLSARILQRIREAGKNLDAMTRDDFIGFYEFHTGGRSATRELGELAALGPGMKVLDVGSGVGGPARTLAAEFGCRVVGLDLTGEFCRAGDLLTRLAHLSDRVAFQQGDALHMPYRDRTFDAVWSQNAIMNIEDKATLFREIQRVLRPAGIFALQATFAGAGGEIHYPTFWASEPALNFLTSPSDARDLLAAAGLVEEVWKDTTEKSLQQARSRSAAPSTPGDTTPLGRDVIVTTDLAEKIKNSVRNLEEGRMVTAQTVWRRPTG